MRGHLSEFTLAQLLQFFALAERSGVITVQALGRESRLLVESDRIVGWGHDDFDARGALLSCSLITPETMMAVAAVDPRDDTPGLSFVVSNLVPPDRWKAFAQRFLEQDVYPLLSIDTGEFDVQVMRCPPAPLRLSISVNSLILDGSRWESEMEAANQEGYAVMSCWRRTSGDRVPTDVRLDTVAWLVWTALDTPQSIGSAAGSLGIPDLMSVGAVKRLQSLDLVELVE